MVIHTTLLLAQASAATKARMRANGWQGKPTDVKSVILHPLYCSAIRWQIEITRATCLPTGRRVELSKEIFSLVMDASQRVMKTNQEALPNLQASDPIDGHFQQVFAEDDISLELGRNLGQNFVFHARLIE